MIACRSGMYACMYEIKRGQLSFSLAALALTGVITGVWCPVPEWGGGVTCRHRSIRVVSVCSSCFLCMLELQVVSLSVWMLGLEDSTGPRPLHVAPPIGITCAAAFQQFPARMLRFSSRVHSGCKWRNLLVPVGHLSSESFLNTRRGPC